MQSKNIYIREFKIMKKNFVHSLSVAVLFTLLTGTLAGCNSNASTNEPSVSTSGTESSADTSATTATEVSTQEPASSALADTSSGSNEDRTDINIAVMTGPTAIGLVKVMKDNEDNAADNNYNFQVFGEATEISTGLVKGELDVACVPCNLASVLYNKTEGGIVVAGINTLGVLYIVETGDTIHSVSDLAGKTIYTTGQGTTPEYTLRYILSGNGINPDSDVTIEFKSEAAEVVSALSENPDAIAMLPQPYVTVAMNNNDALHIALDITEEWEKLDSDSTVITGVVVARKEWADAHSDAFNEFLSEYPESAAFTNDNIEEAAELIEHFGIFKAAIAKKAIPYCNVTFISGDEMKSKISSYLNVLYEQNPASVGGALPGDDFYYMTEK